MTQEICPLVKERVDVLTGPDQVDGVSVFGKDTLVLPLYVIIMLDTWTTSASTMKNQLQSSFRYIQEHIWQAIQTTGHKVSQTTFIAEMNGNAQVVLGENDIVLPNGLDSICKTWFERHIPQNRPILIAFVHDSRHSHVSRFEDLAGKKNVVVAYNFSYNRPLYKSDSPFYNAEIRSIFACPAEVFYKIDATVKKAWEDHTARRSASRPEPMDEDCDDSDYIPDEEGSDSSEDGEALVEPPPIPAFVCSHVVLSEPTTVDKPTEGQKASKSGDTVVVDKPAPSNKSGVNHEAKTSK